MSCKNLCNVVKNSTNWCLRLCKLFGITFKLAFLKKVQSRGLVDASQVGIPNVTTHMKLDQISLSLAKLYLLCIFHTASFESVLITFCRRYFRSDLPGIFLPRVWRRQSPGKVVYVLSTLAGKGWVVIIFLVLFYLLMHFAFLKVRISPQGAQLVL